jgi:hypothetical protein
MKAALSSLLFLSMGLSGLAHALPVTDCPSALTVELRGFSPIKTEDLGIPPSEVDRERRIHAEAVKDAVRERLMHEGELRIQLERDLTRKRGGRCFYTGPDGADASIATSGGGRNFLLFSVSDYVWVDGRQEALSGIFFTGKVKPDGLELNTPAARLGIRSVEDSDQGALSPTDAVVQVRRVFVTVGN